MTKKRKRDVKIGKTRVAGVGGDGHSYGVVTTHSRDGTYRRKPCETCPWRKDSQVGRFPAQAFRESAPTSYDMAETTFACHEAGAENPMHCAGFLLQNADNNLSVRIGQASGKIDLDKVQNPDRVPLYDDYRAMAEANGVDPKDPVLDKSRGNDRREIKPNRGGILR